MHRKSSVEIFPLDHEIERSLFRRKKATAANAEMEAQNSDRLSEGHSNHNEIPGVREVTPGNYWRPMMNKDDSRIFHQPIDVNHFELKLALINMVKQQ